jgi:hypothetical protein
LLWRKGGTGGTGGGKGSVRGGGGGKGGGGAVGRAEDEEADLAEGSVAVSEADLAVGSSAGRVVTVAGRARAVMVVAETVGKRRWKAGKVAAGWEAEMAAVGSEMILAMRVAGLEVGLAAPVAGRAPCVEMVVERAAEKAARWAPCGAAG